MLKTILVMLECIPSIVRWINIDALYLPRKLLLQCLQCQQVIPKDKPIIKNVLISHPVRLMIGLLRVLQ